MFPLRDTVPSRHTPLVTWSLIAVNLYLFGVVPARFSHPAWARWFLTQVFSGTMAGFGPGSVGGVAWWAHVGGFGVGLLFHALFLRPKRAPPSESDELRFESAWKR